MGKMAMSRIQHRPNSFDARRHFCVSLGARKKNVCGTKETTLRFACTTREPNCIQGGTFFSQDCGVNAELHIQEKQGLGDGAGVRGTVVHE